MPKLNLFLMMVIGAYSCNQNNDPKNVQEKKDTLVVKDEAWKEDDSLYILLHENFHFLADSLLKCDVGILETYRRKYMPYRCGITAHELSELRDEFEGINKLKDINGNGKSDFVFVMPEFSFCDYDGESYYFFDTLLPRLKTESGCCHPKNFFVIDDIDEDGTMEIGIYFSACSSRYKSLKIYTLQNGDWKEIGSSTFDTFTRDPEDVRFDTLARKVAKGAFNLCSFYDGETKWVTHLMKD
jgi:hypothetical protein